MDSIGPIVEVTTGVVTCQLIAEDGVSHVQKADIITATLSLINEATGAVINGRDKSDVLSLINSDGKFTWPLAAADTTPAAAGTAHHLAILAATGNRAGGGTWTLRYRFRIIIDNWNRHE
jgi:hypothetical protein